MGLIGLPVFAGFTGGVGALASYASGYIVGFVFMALSISIIVNIKDSLISKVIACIIGTGICYVFGTVWFMIYTNMALIPSLMMCVVPFLIGDTIKIIVAIIISNKLKLKN